MNSWIKLWWIGVSSSRSVTDSSRRKYTTGSPSINRKPSRSHSLDLSMSSLITSLAGSLTPPLPLCSLSAPPGDTSADDVHRSTSDSLCRCIVVLGGQGRQGGGWDAHLLTLASIYWDVWGDNSLLMHCSCSQAAHVGARAGSAAVVHDSVRTPIS